MPGARVAAIALITVTLSSYGARHYPPRLAANIGMQAPNRCHRCSKCSVHHWAGGTEPLTNAYIAPGAGAAILLSLTPRLSHAVRQPRPVTATAAGELAASRFQLSLMSKGQHAAGGTEPMTSQQPAPGAGAATFRLASRHPDFIQRCFDCSLQPTLRRSP